MAGRCYPSSGDREAAWASAQLALPRDIAHIGTQSAGHRREAHRDLSGRMMRPHKSSPGSSSAQTAFYSCGINARIRRGADGAAAAIRGTTGRAI